jgi:PLD-like domain
MEVQFATQPFADGQDLRDFLEIAQTDTNFTELRASVAWAKRSGLIRVRQSLETIRDRGIAQLIIGISEGGATRQGLELALEIASEVYVFHDPTGRTFHPKVYLCSGTQHGMLLVGSHNLTAGGVYYNYEAGLRCQLNLTDEADQLLATNVHNFFDRLISDQEVCRRLDHQLLAALLDDSTYRIGDEDIRRRRSSPAEDEVGAPEDTDTVTEDETDRAPIFGRSASPKRSGPVTGPTASRTFPQHPIKASPIESHAIRRWWKKMSASDAQHPPRPTSAVTGNLRLSKAGHPIDHKTYFRHDFFEDAHWERADPDDPAYEKCFVEMDVEVDGDHLGVMPFRVDYKPGRIADQNNVPTVLKWGGLGARLRGEDDTDEFVVVERLADGSYRLSIQANEPQDFLP